MTTPTTKAEWRRFIWSQRWEGLKDWLRCLWRGHNWLNMVDPIMFLPTSRTCRRCLRHQDGKVVWYAAHKRRNRV